MERYAPTLKDLAARDIISRAILTDIREGKGINGKDYVHLDLRALGKERLSQKLPEIYSLIRTYLGIDPSETPVPVAPTCHYLMGGIPTDAEGHVISDEQGTVVPGLYAVGECACVSVHGANRLGCNSLIDLVVFGARVGESSREYVEENELLPLLLQSESDVENKINTVLGAGGKHRVPTIREDMQRVMTENCGVFRNQKSLTETLSAIRDLRRQVLELKVGNESRKFNYELTEFFELENMLKTAEVMVFSALQREESRGSHFRSDFPERNDGQWLKHTLVHATLEGLRASYRPVVVTKFAPEERRY
jgi:succinate dehydrogenase / fumarate reductase flavoprotein subunit